MNDRERFTIILVGALLAFLVTGAVVYLAVMATESGERNLLIGGLIGTGAFGGGALFALMGITHSKAGTTVNASPPSTINVDSAGDVNANAAPPATP